MNPLSAMAGAPGSWRRLAVQMLIGSVVSMIIGGITVWVVSAPYREDATKRVLDNILMNQGTILAGIKLDEEQIRTNRDAMVDLKTAIIEHDAEDAKHWDDNSELNAEELRRLDDIYAMLGGWRAVPPIRRKQSKWYN